MTSRRCRLRSAMLRGRGTSVDGEGQRLESHVYSEDIIYRKTQAHHDMDATRARMHGDATGRRASGTYTTAVCDGIEPTKPRTGLEM